MLSQRTPPKSKPTNFPVHIVRQTVRDRRDDYRVDGAISRCPRFDYKLKTHPKAELKLARSPRSNRPGVDGRQNRSEISGPRREVGLGSAVLRVIKDVEGLGLELKASPLTQPKSLADAHIRLPIARTSCDIAAR